MKNKNLDPKTKNFLLSVATVSVAVWDISFNLGAFGEIFFGKIFTVWVTVSATCLGCLFLSPGRSPVTRNGLIIMALPTLPMILTFLEVRTANYPLIDLLYKASAIFSFVVSLPYTIGVIFFITQEDIVKLSRKMKIKLVTIAALIGIIGYLVGSYNYLFLYCEDFKVSGNDLPANCRHKSIPQNKERRILAPIKTIG